MSQEKEEIELWKDIPLKEISGRYEVSNYGRIRKTTNQKIRKLTDNGRGYLYFTSRTSKNHKKNYYIHRCVLLAFKPVENHLDLEVNHIDFNRNNNSLSNLEWITPVDNKNYSRKNNRFILANKQQSERLKNLSNKKKHPFQTLSPTSLNKRIITRKQNYDKTKHSSFGKRGFNSYACKLTLDKYKEINTLYNLGMPMLTISKSVGTPYTTVRNVCKNIIIYE